VLRGGEDGIRQTPAGNRRLIVARPVFASHPELHADLNAGAAMLCAGEQQGR
jgi:hypothetical protein